jgi:hypothetical protein
MPPFVVCFHDATPAFARETRLMLEDLEPLVGRRISLGVVPNWFGRWPLAAHPVYCRLLQQRAEDLLLHGYFHRRGRGWGAVTLLAGTDEMNGLDATETHALLERGQRDFTNVFGEPARVFLAPAWQRGHVRAVDASSCGIDHILGFFSLDSVTGDRIALATTTWDCGRLRWLGHVGRGIGGLLRSFRGRVPVLAIHPTDLANGFWPKILKLTGQLLAAGHTPTTVAALMEARGVEVGAR